MGSPQCLLPALLLGGVLPSKSRPGSIGLLVSPRAAESPGSAAEEPRTAGAPSPASTYGAAGRTAEPALSFRGSWIPVDTSSATKLELSRRTVSGRRTPALDASSQFPAGLRSGRRVG